MSPKSTTTEQEGTLRYERAINYMLAVIDGTIDAYEEMGRGYEDITSLYRSYRAEAKRLVEEARR